MNRLEQSYQMAVVQYLKTQYPSVKFAISPGNAKNARQGAINKRMGLERGIPDIMIFKRKLNFSGLFIELKVPELRDVNNEIIQRAGTTSKEQKEWIEYLNSAGYLAQVCYGSNEAAALIDRYLK